MVSKKVTTQLKNWLILAFLVISACACSTITSKPLKPSVKLLSIVPLNISLSEQQLRFTLQVTNPNSFQLPVESIDFTARFNNANIASGRSKNSTVIPANGDATLQLDVTAGIDRLVTTLQTLLQGQTLNLEYELAGNVKIENWSSPIPFDVTGNMDIEKEFEG